jgi:FkbM family methyltransferase
LGGGNNLVYKDLDSDIWEIDLNSSLDRLLIENNFEPLLKKFLMSYFNGLDIIAIDVGANNGYLSIPLARIARKVYSFEPNPKCFHKLKRNIELNGLEDRIEAHELAISNLNGFQNFYIQQSIDGDNLMNSGLSSLIRRPQYLKNTIKVEVKTLDSIIPEKEIVHLVKIDVEGSEIDVLKGSQKIVENSSPIIIWEASISIEVNKVRECFDYLESLSYRSYFIQETISTLRPMNFEEFRDLGRDVNIISAPIHVNFL